MAYNSAYTGSQVDAAVGAVRQKETIWDGKQNELTGTEDQLVGFNSAGEAVAVAAPDPLPTGGEVGQVLTKTSDGTAWDDVPSDLPDGGTDGQILTKTDDGVTWENPPDTGVISFNGRKGEVSPGADDYSASMIKFTDGQTFQQKYDAGQLTGPAGADGSNGQDGSPGADGEDGGYYRPAVDGSGNLTWTASKAGMPAVSGANIKGATGPAGANATINGVNTLNLLEGFNISFDQSGSNLTINAQGGVPVVTTGGTKSAYTATVPGITELVNGMLLVIIPHISNSMSPTLNVNGLGNISIGYKYIGFDVLYIPPDTVETGLMSNTIVEGRPYLLQYDAIKNVFVLQSLFAIEAKCVSVSSTTVYSANMVRGISLQTSTPSSIPNGSIVGVYST